jgi:hypothetical protein
MTRPLLRNSVPTTRQLLARILDEPNLTTQIPALPTGALARLVEQIGLEDAGEIVAFATTEQLARVFDEDLWQSERAGEDERFDAARFLVWLEVMLEAGERFVAQRLSELPPDLVTLAFHQHVLVLDLDLESRMAELDREEATAIEKALSNALSEEIDQFLVLARQHEGWDAVLAALLALDRDHHELLLGILERCCAMSLERIDDAGGLYEVLTSEEMLEADVAAEREDRRAEAGYVAPSSAAAFLKLARDVDGARSSARDPLTAAWFRGLGKSTPAHAPPNDDATTKAPALLALLRDSGMVEATPSKLLPAAEGGRSEPLLVRAMRRLAEEGEASFFERSDEIAYLANVLSAGCSFQGRRMRPIEAMHAAIAVTSLGTEMQITTRSKDKLDDAVRIVREQPADVLFRAAWSLLHRDVVLPAAELACRRLPPAAAARMRAAMAKGAPWRAQDELDALIGDEEALVLAALRGLIDECPTLRGALSEGDRDLFASVNDVTRARAFLGGKAPAHAS